MSQSTIQIAKSAWVISVATLVSRVLGLVREQMIATLFSRTATDAFYVAFRIPNLLRDLFAEGAMSSAFIPTFTAYLTNHGKREAWRLASQVLNLLAIFLSMITLAGIAFSDWIVTTFAGEFRLTAGKFELTVLLTQIMFPFLPLVALAAVVMGVLNSQGSFFLPALAPALFNVGSIVVAVSLYFGLTHSGIDPIVGMAIGTLSGGCLQLLVQVPPLLKKGFVYSFGADLNHPGVRRILTLMGPGTLGLASTQINIFINTWLATSQGEGPVSWLNYAFRLMQFPLGLFGVAIATAALPKVSAEVANKNHAELRRTVSSALRMVFAINVPASFGLIALSQPTIALIYQHGRFKETDTLATANALILYALGLFAYSAVKVMVPVFYALGQSKVPVVCSLLVVALNIALNLSLVDVLGYQGLALGTSLAAICNFGLLFVLLEKYSGPLEGRSLFTALLKMTLASAAMGTVSFNLHAWLFQFRPVPTVWWRLVVLAVSIGAGLVTLVTLSRLLRITEIDATLSRLWKKLRIRGVKSMSS